MTDCKPRVFAKAMYKKAFKQCSFKQCTSKSELKAEQTRDKILQAAFEVMHEHGYQGMRIDSVLEKTGLAKGALYHHFPNKKALGYAVVEEILLPSSKFMYEGLVDADDPIAHHCEIIQSSCINMTDEQVTQGCPVNNLCQEMSGLDEGFKDRLLLIYNEWGEAIKVSLENGKKSGIVRENVDAGASALFMISAMQGAMGTAKCMQSRDILSQLANALCDYLQTLRA